MLRLLYSLPISPWKATVDWCLQWRLVDTNRTVWLSFLWGHCSFLVSPGAHNVLFVLSKNLFPQSCRSSVIKSHWASMSNSLGILRSFGQIPKLGNLLWALELLEQCENFFGIIVLQFMGCLFGGSMVGHTCRASQVCCSQSPCPAEGHCWPVSLQETLKHSKAGLTQSPVGVTSW